MPHPITHVHFITSEHDDHILSVIISDDRTRGEHAALREVLSYLDTRAPCPGAISAALNDVRTLMERDPDSATEIYGQGLHRATGVDWCHAEVPLPLPPQEPVLHGFRLTWGQTAETSGVPDAIGFDADSALKAGQCLIRDLITAQGGGHNDQFLRWAALIEVRPLEAWQLYEATLAHETGCSLQYETLRAVRA